MISKRMNSVIFGGGLDLVTPALRVEPGKLLEIKNYECELNGGYRAAAGYERFDGRASPVDSDFTAVGTGAFTGTFQLAETVTGGTSGATGIITTIGTTGLYLVTVVGTFIAAEVVTGGTSGATATTTPVIANNIVLAATEKFNDVRFDKEIHFRDLIQVVPGTGPVRGVFRHEAVTLATRDFDGSEARMYKATTSGWTQVTASHIIFFDTRVVAIPVVGTVLNDGAGNNATLHRSSLELVAGTEGYVVVTGYTTGFGIGTPIKDGATTIATVTVAAALVTLKPGGKNEWRSHNFTGGVDFFRVYTTDGVNPAMEYDPTADVLSPIYSDQDNQALDIPTFIDVYRNHLFIGFKRGIIRNSEPGDPFLWDAAAGSLEIAVGAEVTGFDSAPSALITLTKRTTHALTGKTSADFSLDVASTSTGARAYTVQHIGTTHMLDDRGIIQLARVQAFGNFENATISRLIQPFLLSIVNKSVASTIVLSNNIYKIFTSDGTGVSLTFQEGQVVGFGLFELGKNVNVVSNSEDEIGAERIFFGDDAGFVFEMEKGVSFDGGVKEAWLKTVFQYLGSAIRRKRFFRAFFDTIITGSASVSITAEYTNGTPDTRATAAQSDTVTGSKSSWDIGLWNSALFDATVVSDAYIDLTGTGDSISLIVYSSSAKDDILTFKDVTYQYKSRRTLRGSR